VAQLDKTKWAKAACLYAINYLPLFLMHQRCVSAANKQPMPGPYTIAALKYHRPYAVLI